MRLVRANRSHAALVYDGANIVGWCQFGPPTELHARMRGYGKVDVALPDWRITCFVVDRDRRGEGTALVGALRIIAGKGGGTVDGYPIAIRGKRYSSSYLNGPSNWFIVGGGGGYIYDGSEEVAKSKDLAETVRGPGDW